MRGLGLLLIGLAIGLYATIGQGVRFGALLGRFVPELIDALDRNLPVILRDNVMMPSLDAPLWEVPAVLGVLLLVVGLLRARN